MLQIKRDNLDELANEHYEAIENYFNKKTKSYKISDINKWIKNCFGNVWDFKKLILAKPNELEQLSKILKFKCCNNYKYFETLYNYLNKYNEVTFFNKINNKEVPYNAYKLVESLNIFVCPYCNRNTIYNISNKNKRTSELDHFYPKSKYPFFALSFYNLIPSCKVCNKIKLDNDEKEYINPYDKRFNFNKNMKFSLKFIDSTFYHSKNGFELNYEINKDISNDEKQRIENNLKDFELKDLYQNHKDIILELIQKSVTYNDSYIDELFKTYEGTLFKNREDVITHIVSNYISEDEIEKRPLSKLIKDISEELGLI